MLSYFSIIFLVKFTTAVIPYHIDLQKVGIAILNHEKYIILKPTVHKVTDHFKDSIRRENVHESVFLDGNGLRHKWSSVDKNLRRADPTETTTKSPVGGNRTRTKGRAFFFCPFLGVITMNAFVEN